MVEGGLQTRACSFASPELHKRSFFLQIVYVSVILLLHSTEQKIVLIKGS